MARRFRYYATADEIRNFLLAKGYKIEENHQRDGRAFGFTVNGTAVHLDYDIVVNGQPVAFGMISLSPHFGSLNPDEPRSVNLYRQLYRKFSKPQDR